MQRALIVSMIFLALTACANDTILAVSNHSVAAPLFAPRLLTTPSPTHQIKIIFARNRDATLVSSNLPPTTTLSLQTQSLASPITPWMPMQTFARADPPPRPAPGDFVDNWELVLSDDAENNFPDPRCVAHDWQLDAERAWSGKQSLTPKQNAWLICGPFDFTHTRDALMQFNLVFERVDANDFLGVGVSTDGKNFSTIQWLASVPVWSRFDVWATGWDGAPRVWFALISSSPTTSPRLWVDDWRIWRYQSPALTCGKRDPGNKGVHLPSHEVVGSAWYPIIRAGDTLALQGLIAANAHWVRLGLRPPDPASPYTIEQEFDRMVDSLCAAGMGVLGLMNHESLSAPFADTPTYRQTFVQQLEWYARHFKDRITFWELWNEPNLPTFQLSPRYYAAFLTEAYRALGAANAEAKLVFGGLASGWNDSNDYLDQVYFYLNHEQGGARPFDVLALHLYFGTRYALDPAIYLRAPDQMDATQGDRTLVDKFARTMKRYGDVSRPIWITEIGWNSAKNERGALSLAIESTTQAYYLKTSFDLLFANAPMVEKIFWYQYHDVVLPNGEPGFWGLYASDKRTAKPAFCAFAAYPQACQ